MARYVSVVVTVTAVQYRRGAGPIPGVEGLVLPYVRTPGGARAVFEGDWICTYPDGTREVVPAVDFPRRFARVAADEGRAA